MEGKIRRERKIKMRGPVLLLPLLLFACGFLPTQAPKQNVGPPTAPPLPTSEIIPPTETIPFQVSPIIVCSASSPDYPNAIIALMFEKKYETDGRIVVNTRTSRTSGTSETSPAPDGGLNPFQGMVRTGLDGLRVKVGRTIDENGKETFIYKDLGGCLADPGDMKNLRKFFKEVTPDQLAPEQSKNNSTLNPLV